jgi:hypothetical protein
MSGTLVSEISVSNVKKLNHGLPLCQNNVNGVYVETFMKPLQYFRNVNFKLRNEIYHAEPC